MASGCFDLLAADYDRTWTNSGAGRLQRNAVWRNMLPLFRSGDTVLDLGCGTGEDAQQLVHTGVRVYAIDASTEMVRIARSRGVNAEVGNIEEIQHLDGAFNGVISDFGALNCVEDLSPLRRPLARLVLRGGYLVICLMGRFCLLETIHFLLRLQFRKAARRWPGRTYAERLRLKTFYPGAGHVKRVLSPEFRLINRIGIGLAVPPSYIGGFTPTSLDVRNRIDEYIAAWPCMRSMADHQLFVFTRTENEAK
jgi:ubiquinone/menaquinone biosynthesis C-methylase UbiE